MPKDDELKELFGAIKASLTISILSNNVKSLLEDINFDKLKELAQMELTALGVKGFRSDPDLNTIINNYFLPTRNQIETLYETGMPPLVPHLSKTQALIVPALVEQKVLEMKYEKLFNRRPDIHLFDDFEPGSLSGSERKKKEFFSSSNYDFLEYCFICGKCVATEDYLGNVLVSNLIQAKKEVKEAIDKQAEMFARQTLELSPTENDASLESTINVSSFNLGDLIGEKDKKLGDFLNKMYQSNARKIAEQVCFSALLQDYKDLINKTITMASGKKATNQKTILEKYLMEVNDLQDSILQLGETDDKNEIIKFAASTFVHITNKLKHDLKKEGYKRSFELTSHKLRKKDFRSLLLFSNSKQDLLDVNYSYVLKHLIVPSHEYLRNEPNKKVLEYLTRLKPPNK